MAWRRTRRGVADRSRPLHSPSGAVRTLIQDESGILGASSHLDLLIEESSPRKLTPPMLHCAPSERRLSPGTNNIPLQVGTASYFQLPRIALVKCARRAAAVQSPPKALDCVCIGYDARERVRGHAPDVACSMPLRKLPRFESASGYSGCTVDAQS